MAAITGSVLAVASAGYQIYNAEEQKAKAKQDIEDFQSQDFVNPYENIRVSTLASDQATQANLSNFATSAEALQRGGARTVLAGLPRLNEGNIALQNQISQDLERQDIQREVMIAQGEENIQRIREGREQLALQGLGQQLQTARQDSASGMFNLASGALAFGSALNNQHQAPSSAQQINQMAQASQANNTQAGQTGFQPTTQLSLAQNLNNPITQQQIRQNQSIFTPFGFTNQASFNNPFPIFNY